MFDHGDLDAAAALDRVQAVLVVEQRAAAEKLALAAHWAGLHDRVDGLDADGRPLGPRVDGAERLLPLAGPGAPLVAEFACHEFGAAIGASPDAAKALIGDALELRHRLPLVWARVTDGTWRARTIARETTDLSQPAAAFVDRQVASIAHQIGPVRLGRLIDAARIWFDPDAAEQRAKDAAEQRRVQLRPDRDASLTHLDITADTAEALAFDRAIARSPRNSAVSVTPTVWMCAAPRQSGCWPTRRPRCPCSAAPTSPW